MKLLAIETSCDETAVSIIEATGGFEATTFTVLGDALFSQVKLHAEFGGVYPNLAKREHGKNLMPLLEKALTEAQMHFPAERTLTDVERETVTKTLSREPELSKEFLHRIVHIAPPDIDAIAVTHGPGLEPTLWVGINFANALGFLWQKPIIPINHMEGHILSSLLKDGKISSVAFPVLALLISGGHTELVLMKNWFEYELLGETLDDAVGEAFDKVARMLALPYPGGPEISKLAEKSRATGVVPKYKLPRPMFGDNTCNFSFSGLKTAVLYTLKKIPSLTDEDKEHMAHEFENAATEVLLHKTGKALRDSGAKTLVLGGGVSANIHIRHEFQKMIGSEFHDVTLLIPEHKLTTDNAVMIGIAGYFRSLKGMAPESIRAMGTLRLSA